jgi:hyperosmotically inducible periplasmic protein
MESVMSTISLKQILIHSSIACAVLLSACAGSPTQSSTGQYIDDAWITTKVKAAFVEDKSVDATNINVETFKGTVQLSGFANSVAEAERAVAKAWDVKGVKSVKNDIRLKRTNP